MVVSVIAAGRTRFARACCRSFEEGVRRREVVRDNVSEGEQRFQGEEEGEQVGGTIFRDWDVYIISRDRIKLYRRLDTRSWTDSSPRSTILNHRS
jgi:hypothetical protein